MNDCVNIQIKSDYYAYIMCKDSKLFKLIEKSFTRCVRKYNNYWKMYEDKQNKYYTLVDYGKTIKVKAGLVNFLVESFKVKGIKYKLTDERVPVNIKTNIVRKLNDKIILRDYQEEAVQTVFNNSFCCVQLMTGSGKEQPITAKVLTPTGFVNIGDLNINDTIIAGDGKDTKVIGKYPQGIKDVYKITFSDNSTAECGLEHIWTVRKNNRQGFQDITLSEILKEQQLNIEYGGRARNWKYEIPLTSVEGKDKNFFIKPYTLGVLIADGCINGKEVSFSCSDIDVQIADKVKSELQDTFRLSKNSLPSCPQYKVVHINDYFSVNEYRQEILRLKLNVKSKDKFIPDEYLYGTSIKQRKELLQGLLDCDGTQSKTKATTIYHTTSIKLAENVKELVQSLGGTAKIRIQDRRHEGKPIKYSVLVQISDFCPFYLKRKAQYWRVSSDKVRRYIKKIELVRKEESICIEVASQTKQYLTNNYIVTHNTEVSASIIRTYLNNYFNRAVLYVVPTIKLQQEAKERFLNYGINCNNTTSSFINGGVNVVTYMALVRSKIDIKERDKVGALIFDEMQHLKGSKFSKIVHNYRKLNICCGISATVTPDIQYKKQLKQLNDTDFNVLGCTGKPVYWKTIDETIEEKYVTPVDVTVLQNKEKILLDDNEQGDWHIVKKKILMSQGRANLVADFTNYICEQNRFYTLMLLIPEVEWSKQFMKAVAQYGSKEYRYILMFGQNKFSEVINGELVTLKKKEKEEAYNAIKNPNIKTIFSATSFAYEGLDIPNLQALLNIYGGRSEIRIKQQIGRLTRLFKGKDIGHIYEIYDKNPVCESQFRKRLEIYAKEYNANIIKSDYGWWEED